MKNVVVLGGYGEFGSRIVRRLAAQVDPNTTRLTLDAFVHGIRAARPSVTTNGLRADALAPPQKLARVLKDCRAHTVIHCCGPYQHQPYSVAEACVSAGANYIDLADDRAFVCGINALHEAALQRGVSVLSGASSVPAVSSAVVDHFQHLFSQIDRIESSISPGNQSPRGIATVRSVLSYAGRQYPVWRNGRWQNVEGWLEPCFQHFSGVPSPRVLANCNVPDLTIFPSRYGAHTVGFKAGLELKLLMAGIVTMASLSRWCVYSGWHKWAPHLAKAASLLHPFGCPDGVMRVKVQGRMVRDSSGHEPTLTATWELLGEAGDGPEVPCTPAVILALKALQGQLPPGAFPACGFFSLDEFAQSLDSFHISTTASAVLMPHAHVASPAPLPLPVAVRRALSAATWPPTAATDTEDDSAWWQLLGPASCWLPKSWRDALTQGAVLRGHARANGSSVWNWLLCVQQHQRHTVRVTSAGGNDQCVGVRLVSDDPHVQTDSEFRWSVIRGGLLAVSGFGPMQCVWRVEVPKSRDDSGALTLRGVWKCWRLPLWGHHVRLPRFLVPGVDGRLVLGPDGAAHWELSAGSWTWKGDVEIQT